MRFFRDFKKYFRYTKFAAKSSLRAEVAGSYLNWLWWIFNPICMMIIYTFIFGEVYHTKEKYFSAFIFIGLTLWDYFNRTVNESVKIVKANKSTVTKIYVPKFILVQTEIMVNFFKMMINFVIIVVLMIVMQVPISFLVFWIIPILVILTIFTFGVSCFLLHYGVFVEDLQNIVKIVLRFSYYGTGIFFSISNRIHGPAGHYLLHYNPMAYMLNAARQCLIYDQLPSRKWMLIWLCISLVICFFGVRKVYKYENSYAKVI